MSAPVRPTAYALWASGVSGYVAEPIASDKAQGFLPTGIARSSYANWLWGVHGAMGKFLDETVVLGQGPLRALTVGPSGLDGSGLVDGSARISNSLTIGPTGIIGATGPTGSIVVSAALGGTNVSTAVARGTVSKESLLFAAATVNGGKTLLACYNVAGFSRVSTGSIWLTFAQPADDWTRLCSAGVITTVAGFVKPQALGNTGIAIGTSDRNDNGIDTTFNITIRHL